MNQNFWCEVEMVEGFVKVNNDCDFETFLVQVSLDSAKSYKREAEVYPGKKKYTSIKKLPTELEFETAIFNVVLNQNWALTSNDFIFEENIEYWFSETYRYSDLDGIHYKFPVWNENGLFFQAESITQEGAA